MNRGDLEALGQRGFDFEVSNPRTEINTSLRHSREFLETEIASVNHRWDGSGATSRVTPASFETSPTAAPIALLIQSESDILCFSAAKEYQTFRFV
jgi:hypothetical protein